MNGKHWFTPRNFNVYHSFCAVPKNILANSMKIDWNWNFQGRSQEHLKSPKNGDGGGSRLKISKGAVWHHCNFSGTTHLI